MKASGTMRQDANSEAERQRQFLRRALIEAKREMRSMEDLDALYDHVLLTAMGILGATSGFLVALDRKNLQGEAIGRGMPEPEVLLLNQNLAGIAERYFTENIRDDSPLSRETTVVPPEKVADDPFCPRRTKILLRWSEDGGFSGLLGLSEKISHDACNEREIRFLRDLADNMLYAIDRVRFSGERQEARSTLAAKAKESRDAKAISEHSREMLNRRIFHLDSLHEISRELADLKSPRSIIEAFLMTTLGIFGADKGYFLLLDKEGEEGWLASRGIKRRDSEKLAKAEAGPILRSLSEKFSLRQMSSSAVKIVTDIRLLEQSFCSAKMAAGLLFAIDDQWVGLAAIGNRLTGEPYSEPDRELLVSLASTCLSAIRNALSFRTIQKLNAALEQRNVELNRTVLELGASRKKIELLERARDGIRAIVHRESKRSDRVKLLDVVAMLSIGTILGLVFNMANPSGVDIVPSSWSSPPVEKVAPLPAYARIAAETAFLVDARPAEFFDQKHIPGAVNLPPALFDFVYMMKFASVEEDKEFIVYGRNISRRYDEAVARKLINRGHSKVSILDGGLSAWAKQGFPVEKEATP